MPACPCQGQRVHKALADWMFQKLPVGVLGATMLRCVGSTPLQGVEAWDGPRLRALRARDCGHVLGIRAPNSPAFLSALVPLRIPPGDVCAESIV